jgi:hypothetical protein
MIPRRKFITKCLRHDVHAVEKFERQTYRQKLGHLPCAQVDFVRQRQETFFNGRG